MILLDEVSPRWLRELARFVHLKNLLFGVETNAWTDDESTRLSSMLEESSGSRMAATGGEAVEDIYGAVPEIGWDTLVNAFLR